MGSPMAPSYANLFMGQLEHNMLKDAPVGLIPLECIKFIDDIFAIWTYGIDKQRSSYNILTTSIPLLYSILSTPMKAFIFLIQYRYLYINNLNQLESGLFVKPTDEALLLHKESFHPNNCKTSIIYI